MNQKRNRWLIVLALIVLFIGILALLYWFLIARFYVYTEDAYVHGNQVMLTPQVNAGIKAIWADETDLVEKGQLVIELDASDYLILFEAQKKSLAQTVRTVVSLFEDVGVKEAEVAMREAELKQAELDLSHRNPLVEEGAVSVEEFEIYQTKVVVAKAQFEWAEKELEKASALVSGTTVESHPLVQEKVWSLRETYLNLIRCQIWAPATGYVAKRTAQVGDQVKEGDVLLYIVPLDQIWIEANYKENHLKHVRIDQPVEYTADMYGRSLKLRGRVVGFQPGSGNAFALLPPENASGNWIKIIQRVPVRIAIDPDEIREFPLFLGLSLRTHIAVHDRSGMRLAQAPTEKPIYTTEIYTKQMEKLTMIDPLISTIIQENSGNCKT